MDGRKISLFNVDIRIRIGFDLPPHDILINANPPIGREYEKTT